MKHMDQRNFKFTVAPVVGESRNSQNGRLRAVNVGEPHRKSVSPEKLLSDLLKRQARTVMQDVTECQSSQLPSQLARLRDLAEIIDFAVRHRIVPGDESEFSGKQLIYANTLADLRRCMDITRQSHRAPVFVNQRDSELSQLNHKVDLLAGLVARAIHAPMPEAFTSEIGENER